MQKTLFEFQTFAADHEINAFIETAKGSGSKFKYEPDLDLFTLHKSLPKGMEFPYDYGFIPSTLGEDGDPLDVLVLIDTDVFPGCLVKARLVGVIEAKQKDGEKVERNDRLIAVHTKSATWDKITELDDLPSGLVEQIEHFFISYHDLHEIEFKPIGRKGAKHALKLIQQGIKRYQKSASVPEAPERRGK
jgi:inorganic pyrophosphatase